MAESKHTPGEWTYERTGNQTDRLVVSAPHPADNGHRLYIARQIESEADARLLAAALEILEALLEVDEYLDDLADADHDETGYVPNKEMRLLVQVRAALEKAGAP